MDLDAASDWLASAESLPEEQVLVRQQVAQVWKVVENLSPRQRTVFLLRFMEELELSEITSSTGLKEGAVKEHLSRAVARVGASLKRVPKIENSVTNSVRDPSGELNPIWAGPLGVEK